MDQWLHGHQVSTGEKIQIGFHIAQQYGYTSLSREADPSQPFSEVVLELLRSDIQGLKMEGPPPSTLDPHMVWVNRSPGNPSYLAGASQDQQRAFEQDRIDHPHQPIPEDLVTRPAEEVLAHYGISLFTIYPPGTRPSF